MAYGLFLVWSVTTHVVIDQLFVVLFVDFLL